MVDLKVQASRGGGQTHRQTHTHTHTHINTMTWPGLAWLSEKFAHNLEFMCKAKLCVRGKAHRHTNKQTHKYTNKKK